MSDLPRQATLRSLTQGGTGQGLLLLTLCPGVIYLTVVGKHEGVGLGAGAGN